MVNPAKKILLPHVVLTELSSEGDTDALSVIIPASSDRPEETYFVRPLIVGAERLRRDGKPRWVKHQFNLFPLALDGNGVPWPEVTVYLLSRLESVTAPVMTTYASIAEDLATYRRFLDDTGLDWTHFPLQKLSRPTYRFNGHLKCAVGAGEIAAATAKRRMGSVIGFYRWLMQEGALTPANAPWKESDRYIDILDHKGFHNSKKVVTTDLSIHVPNDHGGWHHP